MTRRYAFGSVLVFTIVAVSCGRLQETPVVDYAMKEYKLESTPGCTLDDSIPCAIFEVKYPVFLSLDTNVQRSISDRVNYILSSPMGETRPLEEIGKTFIKDFEDFVKDEPELGMSQYFNGLIEVLVASDTLISLRVDVESFTGGASSVFSTNFVNIDPKTGTAYLLDALLRTGYEGELTRIAQEEIREQLGVNEADSLSVPSFRLNDNYGFQKEGIVFCFNESEVASPADGITEVVIPYELLQGWIK